MLRYFALWCVRLSCCVALCCYVLYYDVDLPCVVLDYHVALPGLVLLSRLSRYVRPMAVMFVWYFIDILNIESLRLCVYPGQTWLVWPPQAGTQTTLVERWKSNLRLQNPGRRKGKHRDSDKETIVRLFMLSFVSASWTRSSASSLSPQTTQRSNELRLWNDSKRDLMWKTADTRWTQAAQKLAPPHQSYLIPAPEQCVARVLFNTYFPPATDNGEIEFCHALRLSTTRLKVCWIQCRKLQTREKKMPIA